MKYLSKLIALFLLTVFSVIQAHAQSLDANRMNRDLNIMENILQEMFKTQSTGNNHTFGIASGTFYGSGDIKGTYLRGFGVIFLVPDSHRSLFSFSSDDSPSNTFTYSSDNNTDTKVTEASVVDRTKEFLRNYGSTIGQLSSDDKVMILYGAGQNRSGSVSWVMANGKKNTAKELGPIAVIASKKNLDAYRNGRLSADQFDQKVSVSKTDDDSAKKLMDMEVMSNIFETAFKNEDAKSFRIQGSVNNLLLDNFGALFLMDASYGEFGGLLFIHAPQMAYSIDSDKATSKKTRLEFNKSMASPKEEEDLQKRKEEIKKKYSSFINQLKEYLVDYGRTLSSVKTEQTILVSVSIHPEYEDIPERVDIQINKSILDAMDKGNISRNDVLKEVDVTEY